MLLSIYGTMRTSRVQSWIAGKAAAYLSKELGTRVEIGGVDISWFLDIDLDKIRIDDKQGRSILEANRIRIDLGKLDMHRRFFGIYSLSLDKASIHLAVNPADSLMNYAFILDYFSGSDTATTTATGNKPWTAGISGIRLKDCSFTYDNNLKPASDQGVDYDHIGVSRLNLDARHIVMEGDSICAEIRELSLAEKSGFVLNEFSTSCTVSPRKLAAEALHIRTPDSDIQLNLLFSYKTYNAYNDFIDSVKMFGEFGDTRLNLNDISYFAPEMQGMTDEVTLKGTVKGTVASLKARDFSFDYGSATRFEGDISMDGLPDIGETFIHLKIKSLSSDYQDLSTFSLPGNEKLEIPDQVRKLGKVSIKGYFTGFYYDFVSAAVFRTAIGSVTTDLSLKMGKNKVIDYNGHLSLENWDLGTTFDQANTLGTVDFSSAISGRVQNFSEFDADMDGIVHRIGLYGNEFHNIDINGELKNREFNGKLNLDDKLVKLNFKGVVDLTDSLPKMNFTATVKDAWLSKLNVWDRDSSSCLSTRMDLDFTGSNIDNLLGSLRFDSTVYAEAGREYKIHRISLIKRNTDDGNRALSLKSDVADADFNGKFTFGDFYNSLSNIIGAYLPSLQMGSRETRAIETEQLFDYSLDIKNPDPLTELFVPGFELESEAILFGSFNSSTETILLNGQAGKFIYNGTLFYDWYIRGQNVGRSLQVTTGNSAITWKEPDADDPQKLGIENFAINTFMQGDSIRYTVSWKNRDTLNLNRGDIQGAFVFSDSTRIKSSLNHVDLVINNKRWNASQEGDILIDSSMIDVKNLIVSSSNQKLSLNGKISHNPDDVFNLTFDHLDISNADVIISRDDMDLDGILSGSVTLKDAYNTRSLQSDLVVEQFAFNGEKMGDVNLKSWWDYSRSGLGIDAKIIYTGNAGTHNPLMVKGYIFPQKQDKQNFDLTIDLVNYKLASLSPFLKDFASNLKGMASGNLRLDGTFMKPSLSGTVQLMRTQMKIDYLNVTYSFADQVKIEPGLISASNLMVYDSLGNSGLCNFKLKHDYFSNMVLDMSINAKNLAGLNTSMKDNELFYGSAFATGLVTIKGPFSDLKMDIKAQSDPKTSIYIPINLSVDATENDYIRFVNHNDAGQAEIQPETNLAGVNVEMLLNVTKDANIQLFLPEDIGNIKGNGSGTIQMGIDTRGDITMFGDYTMNSGTFLFTFKNLFNRVFSIQNGGTISFNGSPYEADINMSAIYKVRASLKGIPELADNPEYAGKTVPVDCIINLKNNLYNPDISFNIRLPEADEYIRQQLYASIDTTNEAIMTQQMVSLLVMKSFSFSSNNVNLANTVGSSSIEMVTNQLSNMLSQISKDVDIGLNYRSADALSSEELELALSTHLFNDRVTIDGNLGVSNVSSTQNTNNLVGDVTVDVKITPDGRFRVKAFNKANNPFDISSSYAAYKQGVGIYYKYEFDRFSQLFRRSRKKNQPKP